MKVRTAIQLPIPENVPETLREWCRKLLQALDDRDREISGVMNVNDDHPISVTPSRAVVSDASGYPVGAAVTATELGYVAGLTSTAQTQITNVKTKVDRILNVVDDYGADPTGTNFCTTEINNALAAAVSTGKDLYWPPGTYKLNTTTSLASMHSVRHFGPGKLLRGTTYFQPCPIRGNTNTLLVTNAGSASNDGITTDFPLTLQGAFTALGNYGPVLRGYWDIVLSAGTYTEVNCLIPNGLQSEIPILVRGPDVTGGTPTAIFDGNGTTSNCIRIQNGTMLMVKDIKFIDYTSASGISSSNSCLLATDNVHITNCYDGILSYNGRLYVSGGTFRLDTGNYSAIKSMFQNLHSIGFLYNRDTGLSPGDGAGNGPDIASVAGRIGRGVYIGENSTGHVEFLVVDSVITAIEIVANSRAHVDDCSFAGCAKVYDIDLSSHVAETALSNNNYNDATDPNDKIYELKAGSVANWQYGTGYGIIMTNIVTTLDNATISNSVAETTMHTFDDFLKGSEFDALGYLRVRIMGNKTGNSAFVLRIKLAGSSVGIITINAANEGDFVCEMVMKVIAASSQRHYAFCTFQDGTADANNGTASIDLSGGTAKDLTVTGQMGSVSDGLTLYMLEVWRGIS